VALCLLTPAVTAANAQGKCKAKEPSQGVGKDKDKSAGHEHGVKPNDSGADKDKDKEKHKDKAKAKHGEDEAWERRDGFEHRVFGANSQPPGWSHGKKTGWGNCGVPPGQAKKGACRTYRYQGRRYYYYRDEQGRLVVRRPMLQEKSR